MGSKKIENILLQGIDICKRYPESEKKVLNKLSVELYPGEILAVSGCNGSGKSTLLRILSCLDKPTSGKVIYSGSEITEPISDIILLQQSTEQLFPWLTLKNNIIFPQVLTNKRNSKDAWKIGREKLEIVGITDNELYSHYPSQLSGGQKQRVSLARALALSPKVILMDEPFSAIDEESRASIAKTINKLREKENISIILITHQLKEALSIADRVVSISEINN